MDYRDFLGASEQRVLPHLGGRRVEGSRPFRLEAALPPGWYAFSLSGRKVTAHEPAEPDEDLLESLPSVRGHLVGEALALSDGTVRPLHLLPEWRPDRFAPVVARAWADAVIFHRADFEDEAEYEVREALDADTGLADLKGVPASLRAAFAVEVLRRASEQAGVEVSVPEMLPHLRDVAQGGAEVARLWLVAVQEAREAEARAEEERLQRMAREQAREARRLADAARRVRGEARAGQAWIPWQGQRRNRRRQRELHTLEDRIDRVLHAAGGSLLELRTLGDGLVDVRWRYGDVTLLSMVNSATLQVVDSGVCLSGSDDLVTLESLPGVIDEAVRTHRLVITRRR